MSEKNEFREDAISEKRKKDFEMLDSMVEEYEKKHWSKVTVDQVLKFLADHEKLTGPHPTSLLLPDISGKFVL